MMCCLRKGNRPCERPSTPSKRIWSSRRNVAAGPRSRGIEARTCRDEYPPSPTPYRYLNSGSWAGKASVAAKFLRAIGAGSTTADFHKLNDQELASELYLRRGFPGLQLDHHAKLFQAMHAINDDTLVPNCDPRPHLREVDGVWRNTLTGSTPAVFHFNGGGKRHHLPMEARTWWKRCRTAQTVDALACRFDKAPLQRC